MQARSDVAADFLGNVEREPFVFKAADRSRTPIDHVSPGRPTIRSACGRSALRPDDDLERQWPPGDLAQRCFYRRPMVAFHRITHKNVRRAEDGIVAVDQQ